MAHHEPLYIQSFGGISYNLVATLFAWSPCASIRQPHLPGTCDMKPSVPSSPAGHYHVSTQLAGTAVN